MPSADPTVLIVEDDIVLREKLSDIARSEGYDVETAGSLDYGWELFVRWRPSNVLLNLSVGAGAEFLRRLRTNNLSPRVALLAGSNLLSARPETIQPFSKDQLVDWLRAAA